MSEWQIHDGMGYPVPVGTRVAYRRANGDEGEVVILGSVPECGYVSKGFHKKWGPWHWGKVPANKLQYMNCEDCIIAYRIINDGEEAKREARSELFKKMIEGVAPVGGEPKLPAPKKKVKHNA